MHFLACWFAVVTWYEQIHFTAKPLALLPNKLTQADCVSVCFRDCPANMVANSTAGTNRSAWYITDTTVTPTASGFYNVLACVTKDGWGYNGRIAQQCDQGTYNVRDNRATCTSCPFGFTTANVGAGYTQADCGIAAGYGWYNQTGMIANASVPCPIGTFNNVTWAGAALNPCTTCPTGLTTAKEGSDSADDCNSKCPLSRSRCQFACCSIFLSGKMINCCTFQTFHIPNVAHVALLRLTHH
jgi:hypothetical protein